MSNQSKLKFARYDYAAFSGYVAYACCAMVFSIVLTSMAESLNFPLEQGNQGAGGALHLGRSIAMLLMMLAASVVARFFGLRRSLGSALLFIGGGIVFAAGATGYVSLFGAVLFSALGQGLFEVLVTPAARELHKNEDASRYVNITHAFWPIGIVGVVLVGGYCIGREVSWRVILAVSGCLAFLPGVLFLIPPRKTGEHFPESGVSGLSFSRVRSVLGTGRFWIFLCGMFLAGGSEHCLSFWVPSFIHFEFQENGLLCGLGSAVFAIGMACGRFLSGVFGSTARMRKIILSAAFAGMMLGFLPAFSYSLGMLYAVLFFLGVATGPLWPSIQNLCVSVIDRDPTVMLLLLPCIGIPGCGFFTYLMGVCADTVGLRASLLLLPLCHFLLLLLISADFLIARRRKRAL